MATSQSTVDFILDQLISIDSISTRKMFGEYALYCENKVVGLICDNTLFIKITEEGKKLIDSNYEEGPPYPGAKLYIKVNEVLLENRKLLSELIQITTLHIPAPKPKKTKKI